MVSNICGLLYKHDCVIVPGLGAFIGNYQPAKVRLFESKIYPPSKAIAFNRSLKNNDGLLIAQTANSENISYKQAEEKVAAFVQSCLAGLEKNKSYLFKDIGRLYYDNENNLLFEPAGTVNYLLETTGLPAVSIAPVERLKSGIEDTRPKIQNDQDVEALLAEIEAKQKSKNKRSNVPYWVTFVLAIGLLSSVVGVSLQQGDFSNISRSSFFPDFDSLLGNKKTVQKTSVVVPPIEVKPVIDVPEPVTEIAVTPENTTESTNVTAPVSVIESAPAAKVVQVPKAYIVVGAFFDQQYAEKAKVEAAENGFQTVQLDEYDGALHRVMIVTDIQKLQADLATVKSSMNARAWVYCTSCSH